MSQLSTWPALVLTAGLATRLRPLSDVRAKGAMPVAGEALVSRILRWLRDAGIRRVVLNLHHRPETITRIVGDGAQWGVEARYSWENPILGSAGGPKRALPLLDAERFLIVNGDTITDCDLHAVAEQHVRTGAIVTMALIEKEVERYAFVDADDVVVGFGPLADLKVRATYESTQPATPASPKTYVARTFLTAEASAKAVRSAITAMHFIGVQAVNASAFAAVPDNQPYETVKQLYPDLIARQPGSVRAYRSAAAFLDVGTPAGYLETVDIIAAREGRELDRGAAVVVHPSATVRHSVLWDRVQVNERAQLIDCVVADDAVIPAGARYERSAIVQTANGLLVSPF